MNRYKLSAYSAAAAAMVAAPSIADAQMVHVNIDPDTHVGPSLDYWLDLNADGIDELYFNCSDFSTDFSSGGEFAGYSLQWIYIYPVGTFETAAGNIRHMLVGDTVDASGSFNIVDSLFFYGTREFGSDGDWVNVGAGMGWVNNEGYFGIRFQIDSETHYGWIRLELIQTNPDLLPQLFLKELAYNNTPDAPAPITIYNSDIADSLVLSDIGETNSSEDLHIAFKKAQNETTVSEYRVALFKGVTIPTVAEIETLTPDRYLTVEPTGEDISISFTPDFIDMEGDAVVSGQWYRAIVLSVADGVYAIENDVSAPSNNAYFISEEAPSTYAIDLETDSISSDISGFIGKFSMSDTNVSAVRLYITDNITNIDDLLSLDASYYMETIPTSGINTVHFTPDKAVYESGVPELFGMYYLHVVSVPDSITNSIPSLSYESGYFLYNQYPVAPEISIIGYAGNSSDIMLEFPHLPDESNLEVYRVFVCKVGTDVNATIVGDLHPIHYESVYPSGSDLSMDLTYCNLDIDGDVITDDVPYVAYVAMRCTCDDYFYCITIPSEEFVLGEEPTTNIEDTAPECIIIAGDRIHVPTTLAGSILQITNTAGQIVFNHAVQAGNTTIKLPDLPAGVYIACLNGEGIFQAKQFIITDANSK